MSERDILPTPIMAGSTKQIGITFTGTPIVATWSLSYQDGSIINSREDVVISPVSNNVNIGLSGLDFPQPPSNEDSCVIILTVNATADVSLGGEPEVILEDQPFKREAELTILRSAIDP